MGRWTVRSVFWWIVTWLFRIGILLGAFVVWAVLQQRDWKLAGAAAGTVLVFFWLQRACRRLALGWIIDDNGERQKVDSWSRGHAIFIPTTRSRRIVEEATCRDERRKELIWQGIGGWGLAGFALYAWPHIHTSDVMAMLFGLACLIGGILLLLWVATLLRELLYLSGWQDMKGAKVLDNPQPRPGLEDVVRQKVHGKGRVASQAEALALLNPQG